MTTTKEAQNQTQVDEYHAKGGVQLGPWSSNIWRHDPRHIGFLAARYKFVAKMLSGRDRAIEIGCGDGIGIPIVLQEVGFVKGIDLEPIVITDAQERFAKEGITNCEFLVQDVTAVPVDGAFDGAYSLDVIEHIPSKNEEVFLQNICEGLTQESVLIVGTPNVTAADYASELSRLGHINLKSGPELKELMMQHFHNVFLFSMNDEVVHTGFSPMAHYLLAMGVGRR
jgi:cyclopropane fatty-acyl-phospholipid synthase-like methyltransferase